MIEYRWILKRSLLCRFALQTMNRRAMRNMIAGEWASDESHITLFAIHCKNRIRKQQRWSRIDEETAKKKLTKNVFKEIIESIDCLAATFTLHKFAYSLLVDQLTTYAAFTVCCMHDHSLNSGNSRWFTSAETRDAVICQPIYSSLVPAHHTVPCACVCMCVRERSHTPVVGHRLFVRLP